MGSVVADSVTAEHGAARDPRFALAKFRPPALPKTLVVRSGLRERLTAGAAGRLTVVVGSAGAGKSMLLADWAAARPAGVTAWLSCDGADADPLRFLAGFIGVPRSIEPAFGADAADLLAMNRHVSADVIASIANDAAKLPKGSAIIVDDFHIAAPAVARDMTDLIERWPAETTQLVLAGRFDPPLRLHRLRMSGELCEVRDRDLYFSLADSRELLANFGVQISDADLAVLHQRSEGWPRPCKWPRCRCAAPRIRSVWRGRCGSAARRSPTTSSLRSSTSSRRRWRGSCSTRPSCASSPRTPARRSAVRATRRCCCMPSTPRTCSWCQLMRSGPFRVPRLVR